MFVLLYVVLSILNLSFPPCAFRTYNVSFSQVPFLILLLFQIIEWTVLPFSDIEDL